MKAQNSRLQILLFIILAICAASAAFAADELNPLVIKEWVRALERWAAAGSYQDRLNMSEAKNRIDDPNVLNEEARQIRIAEMSSAGLKRFELCLGIGWASKL